MYYYLTKSAKMIQFKSPEDETATGTMNIKNCRIEKRKFKDEKGDYIYGLNIKGRRESQAFFSYSEQDIDDWFIHLIPMCVLLDLKEHYTRLNKMGKGSFATVYKYERKSDKKQVAIKSLEKKRVLENVKNYHINFLLTEIEIMRKLDHPNIIKLYEVYEDDKFVHLVLELLEGGELFHRIKKKSKYAEADAITIMRNILSALSYCHEIGIVHRDLKPENLILASKDDDYNVKIADFGLAAFVKPGEKLKYPCGSPGYIAYEVLQNP